MWSILAFLAGAESRPESGKSDFCWRLSTKILSLGALSNSGEVIQENNSIGKLLPPHKAQLLACRQELSFLSSLLSAGAMDNLPKIDDKLLAMLKKAIHLQSCDYGLNEQSRIASQPMVRNDREDMKRVRKLWNVFTHDSATPVVSISGGELLRLLRQTEIDVFCGQPASLPSSDIVRECTSLLFFWINIVPAKKARFNRLLTATRSFIEGLVKEASEIQTIQDDENVQSEPNLFALAFPTATSSGSATDRRALLYLEAAAYHLMISTLAVKNRRKEIRKEKIGGDKLLTDIAEQVRSSDVAACKSFLFARLRLINTTLLFYSCNKVWAMLADESMKSRQEEPLSRSIRYSGDTYRLYVAGKAIYFLALSVLGVPAWKGNFLHTEIFIEWVDETPSRDGLAYLVSCLIACLDCLFDTKANIEISANLLTGLASIFYHAGRILGSGKAELECLFPAIRPLGELSLKTLQPTIKRALNSVLSDQECGPKHEIFFRAALTALRGSMHLASFCARDISEPSVENRNDMQTPSSDQHLSSKAESQDIFGDIGDDALAGIDLDAIENGGVKSVTAIGEEARNSSLIEFLTEALLDSRPSVRYSIAPPTEHESSRPWDPLSIQGKTLIAGQSRYVCACLASLAIFNHDDIAKSLGTFINPIKFVGNVQESQEDSLYRKRLAQLVCSDLCSLGTRGLPRHREILQDNFEGILMSLIESLNDIDTLDKFPTSNLSRFKQNSGKHGEERELQRLAAMNDFRTTPHLMVGAQKKRRYPGEELWDFCTNLGATLSDSPSVIKRALAKILLKTHEDAYSGSIFESLSPLSMERECLNRIVVLTNLIDLLLQGTANGSVPMSLFERTCSQIIGKSAEQFLVVFKKLNLLQLAGETRDDSTGHRRAKLIELVSSFGELHMSLIAWVLRKSPKQLTPSFSGLIQYIRNHYLCPLFRRQPIDLSSTLQEIISTAFASLRGQFYSPNPKPAETTSSGPHVEMLRRSILRRTKELLLYVSSNETDALGLLHAIIAAGCRNILDPDSSSNHFDESLIVGISFSSNSQSSHTLLEHSGNTETPIAPAIDEHFCEKHPKNPSETQGLIGLKSEALSNTLVPRILHQRNDAQKKKGAIRLIRQLLKGPDITWTLDGSVDSRYHTVRDLARGLSITMRSCLESRFIDADFLELIILCAMDLSASLANVSLHGSAANTTLAQWCRESSEQSDFGNLTQDERIKSFLWLILMWFKAVTVLFIDQSDVGRAKLQAFRKRLVTATDKEWPWPSSARNKSSDESSLRVLIDKLFISNKSGPTVVNVYAKDRNQRKMTSTADDGCLGVWAPEASVRRAAKEFLAEVIPLCC